MVTRFTLAALLLAAPAYAVTMPSTLPRDQLPPPRPSNLGGCSSVCSQPIYDTTSTYSIPVASVAQANLIAANYRRNGYSVRVVTTRNARTGALSRRVIATKVHYGSDGATSITINRDGSIGNPADPSTWR